MTAYEGLFLATGRADEGARLLRAYAGDAVRAGMLRTPPTRPGGVNTATGRCGSCTPSSRHVAAPATPTSPTELLPALDGVVAAYTAGTRYGIRVDPADGLLALDAGTALTWMDARVHGAPVTPRDGKPVELNALWVNGLAAVGRAAGRCGQDASGVHARRDAVKAQFVKRFRAPDGWLYDVVDAPPRAPTRRAAAHPRRRRAAAQPAARLQPAVRARRREPHLRGVLRAVGSALLTPLGLRSLAPTIRVRRRSPGRGGRRPGHRIPPGDGVAVVARPVCRRAPRRRPSGRRGAHRHRGHLGECGLGSVSEIAEGDAPHRPTGAPFSA